MDRLLKFKLFLVLLISIAITSCVSTQVANLQRSIDKEVAVFTTIKPDKEYIELKYVQADGSVFHRSERLLKKLTERAKKEGADAIINVRYDYQFWWPYASGTAIKYKTN